MTKPLETARILVADDEQPILKGYQQVLTQDQETDLLEAELFGPQECSDALPSFDVCYCQQGQEVITAVRQAREDNRPFAVAFLDVRMPPGIDGVEVAKQIRALDPQLNIVIVTGYSDVHPTEIARQVPPVEKLYYLAKPFHALEVQQFATALTDKWKTERTKSEAKRAQEALEAKLSELQQPYQRFTPIKDRSA